MGQIAAAQVVGSDGDRLDFGVQQFLEGRPGDLPVLPDQDLAGVRVGDVLRGPFVHQEVIVDILEDLPFLEIDLLRLVEIPEELCGRISEGPEKNGHRELPPAVDADIEQTLGVEFKIQPGAAMGDDPPGVERFSRMGLSFLVFEKDSGRAVELADDDPLGPVDDKRSFVGHKRDFTEIDFLLLDVPHPGFAFPVFLVRFIGDEPHDYF